MPSKTHVHNDKNLIDNVKLNNIIALAIKLDIVE